ncbi:MAG: bifunctional riboflavin kinase/FAD synthetase, partial [Anaerolineae bacterium]
VAVGSFDGLHRGHQRLLDSIVTNAREAKARTAVLTFFPHPKRVLQNLRGRYYLTTIEDRVALLGELGIDLVITLPFTEEIRLTRAADFMAQLRQRLDLRQLWGGNFALGYRREGTIPFLRQLGPEMGFSVHQVAGMVEWHGRLVSSSRVRASLQAGDIGDVNGCLGRPYHLSGEVVMGDQRGRTIGVPTANLSVWDELILPANGVYAAYAWVDGRRHLAAANIGTRPTVDGQTITIEAHLLDFNGDLYGQKLKLEFIQRLRPEQKFDGLVALKAQIQADIQQTRQLLYALRE